MVGITETVLRDGHQSLIATRMRTRDMLPAAERLDAIGYRSLEVWAGRRSTSACASSGRILGSGSAS